MLSGGKLYDEGMYGCIFTPPLQCKESSIQSLDEVQENKAVLTKLILSDAAELEYSIAKKIHRIPLWKNYFVVSDTICEPAPVQKDKELNDCSILKEYKLADFKLLSMPYGGTPLVNYKFNLKELDFLNFAVHLIEAGALLTLFGIVHRDIHQGNILVDDVAIPRIIDFNLAILVNSRITENQLLHQNNVLTGQEPPDSTLVNAIALGKDGQTIINNIISKKPIIKKIRNILGMTNDEMEQSLEDFYRKSKSVKQGDLVKWFETYWRTVDSWAVGVNIVDLISRFSLSPEFSLSLKRYWPKLSIVLKRMCAVSPLERIDCIQALNYISPNSFIIRKYGKPWLTKVGTGGLPHS